MAKRTAQDWEALEREAAGVSPEQIEVGARALLAQAWRHSSPKHASNLV